MLRADSRFWLVNNREIWSRISRLTSSAWDIKTKERHWWRHNSDSDRRPLSLPLRYDLVTLCLYDDLGQINVIAGILKLRKRFRMSQILFEHGINSLPLVCWRGYGNLSTRSIAIPRAAEGFWRKIILHWDLTVLTHWTLCHIGSNMVIIGSCNGLLPMDTKLIPEPMLSYQKWYLVAFTWRQFSGNTQDIYPWYAFEIYW